MAPEQFKGMDADRLVDIFAFGDVAYQLITGQHPFGDGDPAVVISRITSFEPRPIRELAPDCPEALASIVHQLLAKGPQLRYQSFKDVRLDMEPVLYQLRRGRRSADPEGGAAAGRPIRARTGARQVARRPWSWSP